MPALNTATIRCRITPADASDTTVTVTPDAVCIIDVPGDIDLTFEAPVDTMYDWVEETRTALRGEIERAADEAIAATKAMAPPLYEPLLEPSDGDTAETRSRR